MRTDWALLVVGIILSLTSCRSNLHLNHGDINSGKFREVHFEGINGDSIGLLIVDKRSFKYGHVFVSNGLVLWPNGYEMHGYVSNTNELDHYWTLYDNEGRMRAIYQFAKSKVIEYVIYDEYGKEIDRMDFVLTF